MTEVLSLCVKVVNSIKTCPLQSRLFYFMCPLPPLCGRQVAQFSLEKEGWWLQGDPTIKQMPCCKNADYLLWRPLIGRSRKKKKKIIVSESGDKCNVTYNLGPQKRVYKEKSLENPGLDQS